MAPHRLRPAVFLDRDGTLIEDRGDLPSACDVVFLADTVEALRKLEDRYLLFIVTNQSGISRGTLSFSEVEDVNEHVVGYLGRRGVRIEHCYVCPHQRLDGCRCIKPNPHFLHEAAKRFGIALDRSYVVGDHPHDVHLARSAGAQGIYVLTGHGPKHINELADCAWVASGIREAVDLVLGVGETGVATQE